MAIADIVSVRMVTSVDICRGSIFSDSVVAMSAIRSNVRAVALIWLLCQAASLSAFVPDICCISHVAEKAAKEKQDKQDACHQSEPAPASEPGDACPMQHDTGAACPMHSGKSADHCVMSNACDGPGTHLIGLFAFLGAIERPQSTTLVLESRAAFLPVQAPPLSQFISIDAPPPKA
jgi:hypothetical protein